MRRIVLIARREAVAYASSVSFWLALLMGPLLTVILSLAAGSLGAPHAAPPASVVLLSVSDAEFGPAAKVALEQGSQLAGKPIQVRLVGTGQGANTYLDVTKTTDGTLHANLRGAPVPQTTLALLQRDLAALAQEGARRALGASDSVLAAAQKVKLEVSQPPAAPTPAIDASRLSRFAQTTALWLVLVGALGMLLQAVVRERSNRALESLLSATRPSELLFGKLLGVGALSALVAAVWLAGGAAVAFSPLGDAQGARLLLNGFQDPLGLAFAGVLFLFAFTMFGSALIALGAIARDVPTAQNLSRPVFGLLLLIFFLALSQIRDASGLDMNLLALIPPLSPFVLMLAAPGGVDVTHALLGIAGMAITTAVWIWFGARALQGELRLAWRRAVAIPVN